jgi:hypothetical protein
MYILIFFFYFVYFSSDSQKQWHYYISHKTALQCTYIMLTPYTLSGFEPAIFCSKCGGADHYVHYGANAFVSHSNPQTMNIECMCTTALMWFLLKTLHPGGIRTWVFCSSGGCDDDCATNKKPYTLAGLHASMAKVCMYICTILALV